MASTPEDEPQPLADGQDQITLSYNTIAKLLDNKLEAVAKSSDIDGVRRDVEKVEEQMGGVARQVRENSKEIATLKSAINVIRTQGPTPTSLRGAKPAEQADYVVKQLTPPKTDYRDRRRGRSTHMAGAMCKEQERARIVKFERARRTIRIWPIAGETQEAISTNLKQFLVGALEIRKKQIGDLQIQWVERVRQSQKADVYDEIKVTFADFKTRDWIASKGRQLAKFINSSGRPTAGFRMEVPDFLAGDFKPVVLLTLVGVG